MDRIATLVASERMTLFGNAAQQRPEIGMEGGHLEGKTYCDPFAMGPITTTGNIAFASRTLLAFVGMFFQVGNAASRLLTLTQRPRANNQAATESILSPGIPTWAGLVSPKQQ